MGKTWYNSAIIESFGVDKDEYLFDLCKESRCFGVRRTGVESENHLGASL
jgi:hypothetical protein